MTAARRHTAAPRSPGERLTRPSPSTSERAAGEPATAHGPSPFPLRFRPRSSRSFFEESVTVVAAAAAQRDGRVFKPRQLLRAIAIPARPRSGARPGPASRRASSRGRASTKKQRQKQRWLP